MGSAAPAQTGVCDGPPAVPTQGRDSGVRQRAGAADWPVWESAPPTAGVPLPRLCPPSASHWTESPLTPCQWEHWTAACRPSFPWETGSHPCSSREHRGPPSSVAWRED